MKAKTKKIIIGSLAMVVGLPLAFALGVLGWISTVNRTNGAITSSGETRHYLLYVPSSYDRNSPTALIISLHAASFWPAMQMQVDRWNQEADKHGFLVVYPSATGFLRFWRTSGTGLELEARFVCDLVARLESSYNIDPARVYITGYSNGGGMALALARRIPRRLGAVGTVAAGARSLSQKPLGDSAPVPLIAFHGTSDRVIPFAGGLSKIGRIHFPAVRDWVDKWAQRNGCDRTPVEMRITADISRIAYSTCYDHADVILYAVSLGGHSWPGGKPLPEWYVGRTNNEINASSLMWDFFVQHPRAPR